jgi:hypothetical protein
MTQDPDPDTPTTYINSSAPKSRGRTWFIVVAMIGFLGLLFTNHFYHTGGSVISCSLWQYYLLESSNGFPSLTGTTLGGPQNAVFMTLAIHLGLSAMMGWIACGVRWGVIRGRK